MMDPGSLIPATLFLAVAAVPISGASISPTTTGQAAARSPYGKTPTSRSIELSAVIDGTPEQIFALWTTVEGVNRFFGVDAIIEPRVGGLYEIYFLPRTAAASDDNSTHGARVLELEPPHKLAFEWKSPPFANELNTDPLPTWVEVQLETLSQDPDRTLLHLSHRGFGEGPQWDRVHAFFERNWFEILYRLKRDRETASAAASG